MYRYISQNNPMYRYMHRHVSVHATNRWRKTSLKYRYIPFDVSVHRACRRCSQHVSIHDHHVSVHRPCIDTFTQCIGTFKDLSRKVANHRCIGTYSPMYRYIKNKTQWIDTSHYCIGTFRPETLEKAPKSFLTPPDNSESARTTLNESN